MKTYKVEVELKYGNIETVINALDAESAMNEMTNRLESLGISSIRLIVFRKIRVNEII